MRSPCGAIETVFYTRSSSAEHPWASESQETAVREHLNRRRIRHERARVIRDATSARMDRRPGYRRIVAMCDQGKAILLAVYDLTRLGRTEAIMSLIRGIVDLGGRVISVKEGVDTNLPGWERLVWLPVERREYLAARRRWRRGEVADE